RSAVEPGGAGPRLADRRAAARPRHRDRGDRGGHRGPVRVRGGRPQGADGDRVAHGAGDRPGPLLGSRVPPLGALRPAFGVGSARVRPIELILGVGGSLVVLAVLLAKPPWWEPVAIVLATLLPAGLVLYGASAARRAREAQAAEREAQRQREGLAREAEETSRSRAELQGRLSELVALNQVAAAVSSTLDLDELLDTALAAIVGHLPFDRALVLLVDDEDGVLCGGRSIGGDPAAQALVADVRLPLDQIDSTLVQLALADGPLVFRDVQDDAFEPNRVFARALDVGSFLGTPLQTKGRTVGVLAVDNRLSGRELERSIAPLLYTVGNLLAAAVENARLYGEIEAQNRELEERVARRTAQLAE